MQHRKGHMNGYVLEGRHIVSAIVLILDLPVSKYVHVDYTVDYSWVLGLTFEDQKA